MRPLFLLLVLCATGNLYAQGCSDAGFCSAGALKAGYTADSMMHSKDAIGLSFAIADGEKGTMVYIPQLEIKKQVGKRGALELKLPYNMANGTLGNHAGPGDIIITYSSSVKEKNKDWKWNYTVGTRIGVGNANATDANGMSLPMVYQSSLGTTDIIAGISAGWTQYLSMAVGYQQPILQYNHNDYIGVDYFSSKGLKRMGDVLLRAEAHYNRKHSGVSAGPLFIYHLADDKMVVNGEDVILTGSKGLTLNLTASYYYEWKKCRFDISAGTPLAVRKYRPDGLTREWVVSPRLIYFFGKK